MSIRVLHEHYREMLNNVDKLLPNEACGLLAGVANISTEVFSIENCLHSPTRFLMEPKQQLDALLTIEEMGWDLLAIYHSHPLGPETPSETDINENHYPETISIIWFKGKDGWDCRAYLIQGNTIENVEIKYI